MGSNLKYLADGTSKEVTEEELQAAREETETDHG